MLPMHRKFLPVSPKSVPVNPESFTWVEQEPRPPWRALFLFVPHRSVTLVSSWLCQCQFICYLLQTLEFLASVMIM